MEVTIRIGLIALGGALGAVARHLVNMSPLSGVFQSFPLATFVINISGSFLIGMLTILFAERFELDESTRAAIIVGFLGAFTTFSTFELELYALVTGKQIATAIAYALLSVIVGFIGLVAGIAVGNRI